MASAQNPKVMVVEDDPILSDLLVQRLGLEKFGVMYAPTGEAALQSIQSEKPDVVLLDIMLPGKDGFQVLKEIKEDPKNSDVPVVILSNLGQPSDIERGKKLGAVEFITKVTLTLDEVVHLVRNIWKAKYA